VVSLQGENGAVPLPAWPEISRSTPWTADASGNLERYSVLPLGEIFARAGGRVRQSDVS